MIKNFTIAIAICGISLQVKGQYFESMHTGIPPGHMLSSGERVTSPMGDLTTSYNPTVVNTVLGLMNFYITEKSTMQPYGSGFTHVRCYRIYIGNQLCQGTQTQLLNLSGITAIQRKLLASPAIAEFALTGASREGCFFSTLDRTGIAAPPSTMFYPFPYLPLTQPSKPFIVQSSLAYEYFICGSFDKDMYVIKVNQMGTVLWSRFYTGWDQMDTYDHDMLPKGIIEDPSTPGDVVIVGSLKVPGRGSEGFLMKLDGSNGNVNLMTSYGQSGQGNDEFSSIDASYTNSGATPDGFIVGGGSGPGKSALRPWLVKITSNGFVSWTNILSSSYDTQAGAIVSVAERYNLITMQREYYGLLNSTKALIVAKLDNFGVPIHISDPSKDSEFAYNLNSGDIATPNNLTIADDPNGLPPSANPPTGMHVFGTFSAPSTNSVYFVSSYYNGVSGCQLTSNLTGVEEGPVNISMDPYWSKPGLTACSNISIQHYGNGGGYYGCSFGMPPAGSNLKIMNPATGLMEEVDKKNAVNVYPNPVTDMAVISYDAEENNQVSIDLYDVLGRHIKNLASTTAPGSDNYKLELSLHSMNLDPGVYVIYTTVGTTTSKQKIVYAK